ncbi:hypothetical protein HNY73_019803 [Argiope bruennichi]|uniref:Transmembrane protein n=1 Tax=Argiope bruennichi TaxID=94029 RepID=A0A8T0E607_ARGBR|nr:hypothetical protein HNY73_019803 [Argiope bruennichi]
MSKEDNGKRVVGKRRKTSRTKSLMIGTGVSVHSKLSLAVILFMTIGMSALMLFFVGGVTYYVIRWCRKRVDDDDALLGDDSIN